MERNIYKIGKELFITNDEEIKYDEYYLGEDNNIYCLVTTVNHNGKKIILTTDQELIKDGVQAIPDEFLEWFVKNPSCEYVEVESGLFFYAEGEDRRYKIIIPKEEPKQETLEEASTNYANKNFSTKDIVADEGWYASWLGFRNGAKWMQERSYSKEEVNKLLDIVLVNPSHITILKKVMDNLMIPMK